MKKKETRVCRCGAPLHWTFLYDGAEYFCMNCQGSQGALGVGQIVKRTPEIIAMQKVCGDVFKALRKHLFGSGRYQKTNCKKCKGGDEYHIQHATQLEKERNKIANKILDALEDKIITN